MVKLHGWKLIEYKNVGKLLELTLEKEYREWFLFKKKIVRKFVGSGTVWRENGERCSTQTELMLADFYVSLCILILENRLSKTT